MGERCWDGQPLTLDDLEEWARPVLKAQPIGSAGFRQFMLTQIAVQFLGTDWFRRYAYVGAERSSYLYPDFDTPLGSALYTHRLLNLGEMLLNLQQVDGVQNVLNVLASGKIEAGMAELQVGMLLYQDLNNFRFLPPTKLTGRKTYDLEIDGPDESPLFGEIKCKEERTTLSATTVRNSLKDARDQLPEGKSGVVFLRVPQAWAAEVGGTVRVPSAVLAQAAAFIAKTARIALVVFYTMHVMNDGERSIGRHGLRCMGNPRTPDSQKFADHLFPTIASRRWVTIEQIEAALARRIGA